MKNHGRAHFIPSRSTLRLGFVPLNDCAPLVMAQELGLFRKHGVRVVLSREAGWATIRDKIIYGELEAAHAVAGLVYACNFGLGCIAKETLTALVLSLHGNAITLSRRLNAYDVEDVHSLKREIDRSRSSRTFCFGIPSNVSSHHLLLRRWLEGGGINVEKDVRIVVVPPPQMFANLKAGHIDGYCVGEPWNSLAVMRNVGWCVATSEQVASGHPEKILLVQREMAESRHAEHLALIAALYEACAFCDRAENRERIIEILAQPKYVGAPIEALRMSMMGSFCFSRTRTEEAPNFTVFSGLNSNAPTEKQGAWVLEGLLANGLLPPSEISPSSAIRSAFRPDIFNQAIHPSEPKPTHETQANKSHELHFTHSTAVS